MSKSSLLILPGDGIGPEVMVEVRKIIDCLEVSVLVVHQVGYIQEKRWPGNLVVKLLLLKIRKFCT